MKIIKITMLLTAIAILLTILLHVLSPSLSYHGFSYLVLFPYILFAAYLLECSVAKQVLARSGTTGVMATVFFADIVSTVIACTMGLYALNAIKHARFVTNYDLLVTWIALWALSIAIETPIWWVVFGNKKFKDIARACILANSAAFLFIPFLIELTKHVLKFLLVK